VSKTIYAYGTKHDDYRTFKISDRADSDWILKTVRRLSKGVKIDYISGGLFTIQKI